MSARKKIKGSKECLWMKWVDYEWSNCGLPTPEPLSTFGKFSTMWVFMGNKSMSSIAGKIARFLLFQPLLQLWHRSWASHKRGDTSALELQTSDSENREPSSWWPWWWQSVARLTGSAASSSSIQGQHQRGRASHRVVFSRGNSDGSPGWDCSVTWTVALASLCSHPCSKSGAWNFTVILPDAWYFFQLLALKFPKE